MLIRTIAGGPHTSDIGTTILMLKW